MKENCEAIVDVENVMDVVGVRVSVDVRQNDLGGEVVADENLAANVEPTAEELRAIQDEVKSIVDESGSLASIDGKVNGAAGVAGDSFDFYRRVTATYHPLDNRTVVQLYEKIRQGDVEAREKMILCNLRFVMSLALKYSRYGHSVLDDLMQSGIAGLCVAVDRFNPELGCAFCTYAVWWVKRYMFECLWTSRSQIRLPRGYSDMRRKITKTRDELEQKHGRKPTTVEIATELGINQRQVIEMLSGFGTVSFSLDAPVAIDDGSSGVVFQERIQDVGTVQPDEALNSRDLVHQMAVQLHLLVRSLNHVTSQRNVEIFRYVYGLNEDTAFINTSLEDVGRRFSLARQRVDQIVKGIWRRLLHVKGLVVNDRVMREMRTDLILYREIWEEFRLVGSDHATIKGSAADSGVAELARQAGEEYLQVDETRHVVRPKRKFVRASPGFDEWKPVDGDGPAMSLLKFVCYAYELNHNDTKVRRSTNKDPVICWVRSLLGYLLEEVVGSTDSALDLFYNGAYTDLADGHNIVVNTINESLSVKQDVKNMLLHVRSFSQFNTRSTGH